MLARVDRAAALCALLTTAAPHARGEQSRPPLPESTLTESATDVDATEAGEVELEANAAALGAWRGGAKVTSTSVELEWRVLRDVGVRVEPLFERTTDGTRVREATGMAGALAFALFHDYPHDEHLQLELLAHTADETTHDFEPSDTELPAAADLVSAVRRGRFTLRGTLGAEAFGKFAHAPLHADAALLTGILPDSRYGFVALDVRAEFARRAPLVIAPELVADASVWGIPLRLGAALPVNVGARATEQSFGIALKLTYASEGERVFAR